MNRIISFIKAHKLAVAAGLVLAVVFITGSTYIAYRLVNHNAGASNFTPNTTTPAGQDSTPITDSAETTTPETTPDSTPVADNNPSQAPATNTQPEVNLFFQEMTGEKSTTLTRTILPHGVVGWVLDATGANLVNSDCKLVTTYTAPNQAPFTSTGPLNLMPEGHASLNENFNLGNYEFKAECVVGGKTYIAVATASISAYTPSICDTSAPSTTSTAVDLTDLQTKIVGKWRGCMRWFKLDPDMAYQVEFTFNNDGTYTALNYEKVINSDVPGMYNHPATYWGDDNQTLPFVVQSIDNAGTGYGTITLFSGNEGVNLNKVQVASNDTLHFEIKDGNYGPLVYDLTRVTN